MRYEIRIDGAPSADVLLEEFPELRTSVRAAQTVLSGVIADETQLYGLLLRFQELGLHVTEFRRVAD